VKLRQGTPRETRAQVQPVNVLTDHETYQSGLLEGDEGHVSLGRYGFVKLLVNVRLEALLLQRPHSTRTPVKKFQVLTM
jgi:hypothetical protein